MSRTSHWAHFPECICFSNFLFLADVFSRDKNTAQTQKSGSHQVASGLHLGHFAVAAYEEMRKMQTPHFLQGCEVAEWSCKFDVPVCTMIKEFVQKTRNHKKAPNQVEASEQPWLVQWVLQFSSLFDCYRTCFLGFFCLFQHYCYTKGGMRQNVRIWPTLPVSDWQQNHHVCGNLCVKAILLQRRWNGNFIVASEVACKSTLCLHVWSLWDDD